MSDGLQKSQKHSLNGAFSMKTLTQPSFVSHAKIEQSLNNYDRVMDFEQQYTIQEVEEQTTVPSATLRQWERRYNFPQPQRSSNGYRLYSHSDIESIEAMKTYIENGVPSSRAAKLVQHQVSQANSNPHSLESLCTELTQAFLDLNENKASQVLSKAHALHKHSDVLIQVMQKSITQLGKLWHKGQIDIATEHFASNYVQARLRSLLNIQTEQTHHQTIIVTCAPLEQHELGALMVAVMLRQASYHVVYLGANTPLKDLSELSHRLNPNAVLISATTHEAYEQVLLDQAHLKQLAPVVALGGQAFSDVEFKAPQGSTVIKGNAQEAVTQLQKLLSQKQQLEPRAPFN